MTGATGHREQDQERSSGTGLSTVPAVGGAAVLLAVLLQHHVGATAVRPHAALVICLSSGLFLVAASLRSADFLVSGRADVHARAIGLVVVAVLLVPVHLWVHLFLEPGSIELQELALLATGRVTAAVVVVTVLLLAIARPRRSDRLYLLSAAAWTLAGAVLVLGGVVTWLPHLGVPAVQAVSLWCAALWAGAAAYSFHRSETRPWARGIAPFLQLMALAEVLGALDPTGPGAGTVAAALIVVVLAVFAVLRSVSDLVHTVGQERRRTLELERDLLATRDDLTSLRLRERDLSHDARSTLAGIRSAMEIWARSSGVSAADATASLRTAALAEISRLEQALSSHRVELGCGPVALDEAVDRAFRAARGRGAEIALDVPRLVVLGQASDLEVGLREVIDTHLAADPARRVQVECWRRGSDAVVDIAFSGRPTHAAELARASRLLDRQGGSLTRVGTGQVRLVLPMCPAPTIRRDAPVAHPLSTRLPRQRTASA